MSLIHIYQRIKHGDRGATAIEYGLITAGIAVFIVTVVYSIGDEMVRLFTYILEMLRS